MKNETKTIATYKEFGKLLREIANIYSTFGDEPLPTTDEGQEEEFTSILREVERLAPMDTAGVFHHLRNTFAKYPFDVDRAKRWSKYLNQCEKQGIEPDYDNWETDLKTL